MLPLHPHDPPAIGPYRLLGRLGTDDTVHRYAGGGADDQTSVTIVLLRPEPATDPEFRAGFARRVEALQGLRSPYVCPVADADTRGPVPWVAFARPVAQTLADLIEGSGGVLPPQQFSAVASALAAGLADLHGTGVFLGSLRVEDVLLVSGTAVFAEAVSTEPIGDDGVAEDVCRWAALMSSVMGDAGPPLRFRKLIDGCLHPDPALRPTAHELVRMLDGTGAVAEAPAPSTERRPRTDVLAAVTTGVLMVAVVAATASVVTRDGQADPSDTAEAVVTDCTEARGFAPADDRGGEEVEVSKMTFSPDGDLLALSSIQDGVSVWAWREGTEIARLSDGRHELGSIGFLAEGCTVAAAVPDPGSSEENPPMTGMVFDLVAGTSTEYRGAEPASGIAWEESMGVHSLAVSPDGLIALAGWHIDTDDDVPLRIVDGGSGEPEDGIETVLDTEGFWPVFVDEQRLAVANPSGSGYWSFSVWDVRTGERLHTIAPASYSAFAPIPETNEIVYVYGDEVIISDFVTGARVDAFTMDGFTELLNPWVAELVVDPWLGRVYAIWAIHSEEDGKDQEYFASAWDLETREDVLPESRAFQMVAPHPDGEVLAVKPEEGNVQFLDPETWESVGTLIG